MSAMAIAEVYARSAQAEQVRAGRLTRGTDAQEMVPSAVRERSRVVHAAIPNRPDVRNASREKVRQTACMLVDRKAETAPIMGNRILARVSRLFSFAVERDWIEANPALRIGKPADEKSRDRVLSRNERRELWAALHQTEARDADGRLLPRLSQTLNDAFIVMLLTAQRGGEVCRMRWQEVDLATGWWTIPGDVSKNDDPHRVPLTAPVVEVLQRRRFGADDRYVFSNDRHTCVSARVKKAASTLSKGLSFEFRAHDLRRTAASFMGEAGVDRFHRGVGPRQEFAVNSNSKGEAVSAGHAAQQGQSAQTSSTSQDLGQGR